MTSSSKNHRSSPDPADGPAAKRSRPEASAGLGKPAGPIRVVLNPADCNLDFDIDGHGLHGHALHEHGFAYCWSGARANVGINGGKYCFGCKITAEQMVEMVDTPSDQRHLCRVGISKGDEPIGNLGESSHSFGFGGTGKFSNAGEFSDYGVKFGVGDTIVCCVDLENKPLATIGFSKNGKWLGLAYQFDASLSGLRVVDSRVKDMPWQSALFPHVLLKNVVVELQFSIEDGLVPQDGYKPWNYAIEDGYMISGPSFSSPKECEVLMLVGLPASGKTTWTEEWVKEHPEKRYVILGTNLALDQMKVPGLLRKHNYGERFERLMNRATEIFNTLLTRAAKTPRNYILDQTNVYKNARKRKLKEFLNFRKVAVVVFPSPGELKSRAIKRFEEMGKEVPQDAVNEMLANYVLPTSKNMPGSDELFDEVIFTELSRYEAQRYLDEMKCAQESFTLKRDASFYSCQSSIQSLPKPASTNKCAPPVGGHWQSPQPETSVPHYDSLHPLQAGQARQGHTNFSVIHNTPHGPYSNFVTSSFQDDGSDPSLGSRMSIPCMRIPSERSSSSMRRPSYGYHIDPPLYSRPGAQIHDPIVHHDGVRRPSTQSPNFISGTSYNYPSEPPSYTSLSAQRHMPGLSPLARYASGTLPGEQWSSHPTPYGPPYASSCPRPTYSPPYASSGPRPTYCPPYGPRPPYSPHRPY